MDKAKLNLPMQPYYPDTQRYLKQSPLLIFRVPFSEDVSPRRL